MRLTVHEFISLDGVVQGPGGPDEDTSDGFAAGGWMVPYTTDPDFGAIVDGWFVRAEAILLGRTTFEVMRTFWPHVGTDDPTSAALNGTPKYVVSRTLTDPGWEPTTVLPGDPVASVAALKARPGDGEVQVHGSALLAATLHAAGLVDEYRLVWAPVTLGAGKRLFGPGASPSGFELVESRTTSAGALYTVLRPTAFRRGDVAVEDGREVNRILD
jgi:dihydrofolate reductase